MLSISHILQHRSMYSATWSGVKFWPESHSCLIVIHVHSGKWTVYGVRTCILQVCAQYAVIGQRSKVMTTLSLIGLSSSTSARP